MFWPESSSALESDWFSDFRQSIYFEEKTKIRTKIRTKWRKKADSIWRPSDLKLQWTDLQTDKFRTKNKCSSFCGFKHLKSSYLKIVHFWSIKIKSIKCPVLNLNSKDMTYDNMLSERDELLNKPNIEDYFWRIHSNIMWSTTIWVPQTIYFTCQFFTERCVHFKW